MASIHHVRQYLAYWFQLGKPVYIPNNSQLLLPEKVLHASNYSKEFENCWRIIINSNDAYLMGSTETIKELLKPCWEITNCARCQMPIALKIAGICPNNCPCADLGNWPQLELPLPRSPEDLASKLVALRYRLTKLDSELNDEIEFS